MKYAILAILLLVAPVHAADRNSTLKIKSKQQLLEILQKEHPFKLPETGSSVSFSLGANENGEIEAVTGRIVRINEKGVLIDDGNGMIVLYRKSNMPLESQALFYPDSHGKFLEIRAAERYQAERQNAMDAIAKAEEQKLLELRKIEYAKQAFLDKREKLFSFRVMQFYDTGILAVCGEKIIYLTGYPKGELVTDDLIFNETTEIPHLSSSSSSSEGGIRRIGGYSGPWKEPEYAEETVGFFRAWKIGAYTYRTTTGASNTVHHYTADINEAKAYYAKKQGNEQ